MEKVIITFADGTEIEADHSGTCYIADDKPVFPYDLSVVTVSGDEERIINNAQLVECFSVDGRYWFAFIERSEMDVWRAEIEDALCDLSRE